VRGQAEARGREVRNHEPFERRKVIVARGEEDMATTTDTTRTAQEKRSGDHTFVKGVHGVRYQVKDVARSVRFYTTHLGFTLKHQQLPAFANVSLGDADLLLSGPQASGSRAMPNGQQQAPGGWNRVVLRINDLPGFVETLKKAGGALSE
jgi:glyoxylase I family protein